jgi:hypothetical protein
MLDAFEPKEARPQPVCNTGLDCDVDQKEWQEIVNAAITPSTISDFSAARTRLTLNRASEITSPEDDGA